MMRNLLPLVNSDNFLFPHDVFRTFFSDVVGAAPTLSVPKIDLEDCGDKYELKADLPGMNKEDVQVTYDNNVLSVTAQHKEETDKDEKNYVYRERINRAFCRRLIIPHVEKSKIDASFADGVLKVVLPKEDAQQTEESKQIEIR
ncbi:Hsp20/alpha crystallin family protein [Colibacter massiliensis]|uniref:Hsp20/alpha crystallin family protein n=1 Tax=Colibacter massiliensis TaxID=1852379 RepID=UPI0009F1EC44|nr:Hsp20/alpha crystallin family protein [Colibacter massiliensis]